MGMWNSVRERGRVFGRFGTCRSHLAVQAMLVRY